MNFFVAPSGMEPRVRSVLLTCVLLLILGIALNIVTVRWLETGLGWTPSVVNGRIAADAPMYQVWQVRLIAALNQILVFLVPGALTVLLFRYAQPRMYAGVSFRRLPTLSALGVGIAILMAAIPFVLYSYQVNQMLPMPESMRLVAEQAEVTIKAILQMPTVSDFVANLLLIAVLPALGEELVFRGVLQQQLMRRMSPWAAIILTGAAFSFFHFQMDGFLPRWLLGVILGWAFWRSGRFWVPVLMHVFYNGIQVIAHYVGGADSRLAQLDQDLDISIWAALFSVILSVSLARFATKNELI